MKLKVGDRVRQRGTTCRGVVQELSIDNSERVRVQFDHRGYPAELLPELLVRIKPKVKREPRVIWVNEYKNLFGRPHESKKDADEHAEEGRVRCIKFVEEIGE